MSESICYTLETDILQINSTSIKIQKKNLKTYLEWVKRIYELWGIHVKTQLQHFAKTWEKCREPVFISCYPTLSSPMKDPHRERQKGIKARMRWRIWPSRFSSCGNPLSGENYGLTSTIWVAANTFFLNLCWVFPNCIFSSAWEIACLVNYLFQYST